MKPFDVVLGKTNDGNYCCTNISQADVFLMILPELKKRLNTKTPETMSPMYSNEMSPIAVNFYDENKNLLAIYKREKIVTHYSRLTPFSSPIAIKTPMHNVITIYDEIFCDIVSELTHGALNLIRYKPINTNI